MFHHITLPGSEKKTIFLLHGTGGTENDLVHFVKDFQGKYTIVGLKGNVDEQGQTRFFARKAHGVFDMESIKIETKKLSEFLKEWYEKHEMTAEDAVFVGYSNGANMILATLFLYPDLISKAALLHPMLPFDPNHLPPQLQDWSSWREASQPIEPHEKPLRLQNKQFLITYGEQDPMVPLEQSLEIVNVLKNLGAEVSIVKHDGGHGIAREEVEGVIGFVGSLGLGYCLSIYFLNQL